MKIVNFVEFESKAFKLIEVKLKKLAVTSKIPSMFRFGATWPGRDRDDVSIETDSLDSPSPVELKNLKKLLETNIFYHHFLVNFDVLSAVNPT